METLGNVRNKEHCKIKNAFDGLISRSYVAKENVIEVAERSTETSQTGMQREKKEKERQ